MQYNSQSIQVLEGLEPVRKRPGMYIGSTDSRGLHHLIWEIVDNSVDEALAKFCDKINVVINSDNSISIEDNGRGIPVDIHEKTGKSAVETVFTILHAGGKFNSNTYKVSGGLHGVGSSVVNALSSRLEVDVYKNNKIYNIKFVDGGKVVQPLQEIGTTTKQGTKVTFLPDWKIFDDNLSFNLLEIQDKFKQIAYLNKKLKISLHDKRGLHVISSTFYYENGIKDYLKELLEISIREDDSKKVSNVFYCEYTWSNIIFEVGFQYTSSANKQIFSFCNNIFTPDGGTHLEGVKASLIKSVNNFIKNHLKKNFKYNWDDIQEGINLIVSIKHPDPQYEGQTKNKLSNTKVQKILLDNLPEKIYTFLLENPKESKKILDRISLSQKARLAANRAREGVVRKNLIDSFSLPGKLSDCASDDPNKTELYIVEGDSAGGSAKLGRDREYQAILPLRGKVINAEKTTRSKILSNNEIKTIITALGTEILSKFNIGKLRYKKIIIMTDADVDGSHIRILLLTFFYKYMRSLIEDGNIYIAQPPLYRIQYQKNVEYLYSDEQLNQHKNKFKKNNTNYKLQRYKGLGEMNPDQLWDTTMNPANRSLLRIKIENSLEASNIITRLMGTNVDERKQFITENAQFVKNLDI